MAFQETQIVQEDIQTTAMREPPDSHPGNELMPIADESKLLSYCFGLEPR